MPTFGGRFGRRADEPPAGHRVGDSTPRAPQRARLGRRPAAAGAAARTRVISARTQLAAVIGDPVEHSLSPAIHNAAFDASGIDCVFLAFGIGTADLAAAVAGLRALGTAGLSVTMPHKSGIVPLLDRMTAAAQTIGAVNCVSREGTDLAGHNTDGDGLVDALREAGSDPGGRRCLVLGAGGAARAAVFTLGRAGAATVAVRSRRPAAAAAAANLAGPAGVVAAAGSSPYDLIVNATPLGMRLGDPVPVDPHEISAGQTVVDLAYAQGSTPLLAAASAAGAVPIDGTTVLLHQAARAFEIWTGRPAPLDAMRGALRQAQDEGKLDR